MEVSVSYCLYYPENNTAACCLICPMNFIFSNAFFNFDSFNIFQIKVETLKHSLLYVLFLYTALQNIKRLTALSHDMFQVYFCLILPVKKSSAKIHGLCCRIFRLNILCWGLVSPACIFSHQHVSVMLAQCGSAVSC